MTRTFHLGDLVSVVTGRLVSPRLMDGVYDVVDYVTGQAHYTHQLPRACKEIAPELIRQHPWLARVTVPEWVDNDESCARWLRRVTERWGTNHEVEPLPLGAYVGREPIAELREKAPQAEIIAAEIIAEINREDTK